MEATATYPAGLGAGSQRALNPVAPTPVNPSCFGNIEDVVGSAESAAGRVERVVNRLIGEEPVDPRAEGKPAAFGLFNLADEHARDIRRHLQRIFHAVERLEKQLP